MEQRTIFRIVFGILLLLLGAWNYLDELGRTVTTLALLIMAVFYIFFYDMLQTEKFV